MKVIVVGCGLAGLSSAINAVGAGFDVTMVTTLPPARAQSILAAGGINAALNTKGEDDDCKQHFSDTMNSGVFLADEQSIKDLTSRAPEIIERLAADGVVFSRDKEGRIDLRNFGGQKKKRTAYSKTGIGKQLVSGLTNVLRKYIAEGKIKILTDKKFIKAIIIDDHYQGMIVEDTGTGDLDYLESDVMIAASGGMGGLFGKTTGSVLSDGSVTASLFASGIELANLEMIQYHPTTVESSQKRILISEAARGAGGRLFTVKDGKRWYFMEDWYGKSGNLMPRDIVSRAIYKVVNELNLGLNGKKQVGLDLTELKASVLNDELMEIMKTCRLYLGIDPAVDVIPVYPGVHYFMGGINVDRGHHTSIKGIFAAGECACIYHGANRLGGNSTLGAIYGGIVVSESLVREQDKLVNTTDDMEKKHARELADIEIKKLEAHLDEDKESRELPSWILLDLQMLMSLHMGIIRDQSSLEAGMEELNNILARKPIYLREHVFDGEKVNNLGLLAKAMMQSALYRKESRGAHYRNDYPKTDEAYRKTLVSKYEDGKIINRLVRIEGSLDER